MKVSDFFPVWNELKPDERDTLETLAQKRIIKRGDIIHSGSEDCTGLVLIESGLLRAYIISEDGREITLYRLLERDICLFSASCIIHSLQFDLIIQAERDTECYVIPAEAYKALIDVSAPLANYTNSIMASRFSEVMWLLDQILWHSVDKRLAEFLLNESTIESSDRLKLTHVMIANHLGTAREVITRMLNYFQKERLVKLTRGKVVILDRPGLEAVAG